MRQTILRPSVHALALALALAFTLASSVTFALHAESPARQTVLAPGTSPAAAATTQRTAADARVAQAIPTQSSASQPVSASIQPGPAAVPSAYRLAAGDSFDLTFRYTPEFNQTVLIQPDGRAVANVAGEIQAAGLTVPEIHDEIAALATAKLVNPDFTVALKDFEHPRFVVAGEVASPGRYELRGPTTALQAILSAGGQKETASLSHVVLFRRAGPGLMEVHHLNFGKIDYGKRLGSDMLLEPGDMILVPRDNVAKFGRYIRTFNLGVYFNPNTGALP